MPRARNSKSRFTLSVGLVWALAVLSSRTVGLAETPQAWQQLLKSTHVPEVDYSGLPTLPDPQSVDSALAATAPTAEGTLRVVFLGNTIISRCTEYGYLETELKRLMPNRQVSFRNLGWPGDTISGAARVEFGPGESERSNWQRPDRDVTDYGFRKMLDQLRREQPHLILVAYGSNVAFEGGEGLPAFRAGLHRMFNALQPTGAQLVFMSPPPREVSGQVRGNLASQNRLLSAVAAQLKEFSADHGCGFVDLFNRWQSDLGVPYTDNGIHLNAAGYQQLARITAESLALATTAWQMEIAVDGSLRSSSGVTTTPSVKTAYGLRWEVTDSHLPTVTELQVGGAASAESRVLRFRGLESGTYTLDIDGQRVARASAREWGEGVRLQRGPDFDQLEKLRQTVLRKNHLYFYRFRPQNRAYIQLFRRHERGHHAAEVDRFNLLVSAAEREIARLAIPRKRIYELVREDDYPDHEVPGEATEPNVERELAAFSLPDGFEINLFAADPMVAKPINVNWDERGRMWVATSAIYPHLQPGQVPNDKILILEDIDGDGQADRRTVFADGLLVPQSVLPGHGGVFVAQSTELLFLRDLDGDDVADERKVLFTGFGNADVHHMIHGLRWGPGGDLFFQQSSYTNSVVETPWGIRVANGSCTWRLRPETLELERWTQGMVNPWGLAFDEWGVAFATDGAGGGGITHLFAGSANATHPYAGRVLASMNPGRPKECGLDVLSGRHLPEDWQHTLLTNDFRANRVTRYRVREKGSSFQADFLGDMITSRHRGFRPVDVRMGPDGAIYIVDWYNLIIDHGEVDFHHPLRDKMHGRIWRLTAKGRATLEPPVLAGADVDELLEALRVPELWTRDQARRLLREAGAELVLEPLSSWLKEESRTDHDRVEALWVLQGLRVVEPGLLRELLVASDARARVAAVRVLSDWHADLPDAIELLASAVSDEHPRVRLTAVNALRRIGTVPAFELAMQVVEKPLDSQLDFAAFRTAHELRDRWLPKFQAGNVTLGGSPQRIAFALSAVGSEASLKPLELLVRSGKLNGKALGDALVVLASHGTGEGTDVVFDTLPSLAHGEVSRVLEAFLQSDRRKPPTDSAGLLKLLASDQEGVRRKAIQLVGRWRLASAQDELTGLASDAGIAASLRLAAAEALVSVDRESAAAALQQISDAASDPAVKTTSVAALARASLNAAAPRAATLLSQGEDAERAALLAEAFLNLQGGSQALADSLGGSRVSSSVANTVVQQIRLSGVEHAALESTVRRVGQLGASAKSLTATEITQLLRDVVTKGRADRGRQIFQREQLQCVACHAIGGQGGRVGPDLSSLGGSARLGDIVRSLIDPSASIKQGYQTMQLILLDGRVVTGIVQQDGESQIRLRDAKNQLQTIAKSDIDEMIPSPLSIMPSGLIESLTRDELIDLARYLSELGRN